MSSQWRTRPMPHCQAYNQPPEAGRALGIGHPGSQIPDPSAQQCSGSGERALHSPLLGLSADPPPPAAGVSQTTPPHPQTHTTKAPRPTPTSPLRTTGRGRQGNSNPRNCLRHGAMSQSHTQNNVYRTTLQALDYLPTSPLHTTDRGCQKNSNPRNCLRHGADVIAPHTNKAAIVPALQRLDSRASCSTKKLLPTQRRASCVQNNIQHYVPAMRVTPVTTGHVPRPKGHLLFTSPPEKAHLYLYSLLILSLFQLRVTPTVTTGCAPLLSLQPAGRTSQWRTRPVVKLPRGACWESVEGVLSETAI
jgi:hypothetical protein